MKRTIILLGFLALLLPSPDAQAATVPPLELIVTGGQLMGTKNVPVGGETLDVQFLHGSCIEDFTGCDSAMDDFYFQDLTTADVATHSLDMLVFNDGSSGMWDSFPWLTNGCNSGASCSIVTPFEVLLPDAVNVKSLTNLVGLDNNIVHTVTEQRALVSLGGFNSQRTYARWSSSVSSVPIPSSLWLMGSGLLGLVG